MYIPSKLNICTQDKHILHSCFFQGNCSEGVSVRDSENTVSCARSLRDIFLPKSATMLLLAPANLLPGNELTATLKVWTGTL